MKNLVPCLWFENNAEEAVNFYTSVFKDGRILQTTRYDKTGPLEEGTVLTISFIINGTEFLALNGGPHFTFNPAVSFIVNCKDQNEIDYYWDKLSSSSADEQCGWLKDKFGLSWQIVPHNISELLHNPDSAKSARAMKALLTMKKIEIDKLVAA